MRLATAGRSALLASFVSCLVLFQGCQHYAPETESVSEGVGGAVHGGQQPVAGAQVLLYYANLTQNQGQATLLASTTTTAAGNFTLPSYTCPAANPTVPTYLVAREGNPGYSSGTVNNTALALMAALGPCNSLTSSIYISVNEQTTVAAVGVLYPYMSAYNYMGSTSLSTLTSAFTTVQEYVNYATGQVPGATLPAGYYASQEDIVTVADILAPCINSTGLDTNCSSLFALLGTPAPTDTIAAAIYLFNHPTSNTGPLWMLINSQAPYETPFSSAPSTYALSITPIPATPVISPDGGTIGSATNVTISETTSGVSVYYTTNGTTPTAGSTLYAGGFPLSSSGTVEAIAIASSGASSAVATAAFTVQAQTATPVITGGPYSDSFTVTDATPGAVIYYAIGSTATTSSTVYTGPVALTYDNGQYETITAVAQAQGDAVSSVASISLNPCGQDSPPYFVPGGGTYNTAQTVTIYNPNGFSSTVYLSINGGAYSAGGGQITVSTSETLQAYASGSPNGTLCPSNVATAVYTLQVGTPTFTATGSSQTSKTVTMATVTPGATIYYTTDGSTPTSLSTKYTSAITVTAAETVKAIGVAAGYLNSAVGTYSIDPYGIISTFVGNGTPGFTSTEIGTAQHVAVDSSGNVYIADTSNNVIRKVTSGGAMSTFAGNGTAGFGGDLGSATSAELNSPYGVAVDASGNVYIADTGNQRIRKVTGGTITTIAGSGPTGNFSGSYSGDGLAATSATLNQPQGVAVDASGNIYIADTGNNRIRKIVSGTINTVVGSGNTACGASGDGGSALSADLCSPWDVALDASGALYIADAVDQAIRKVSGGIITTFAGSYQVNGSSGDGGPASMATLSQPEGVTVDVAGNVYIADYGNSLIREVTPSGTISTVAGLYGLAGYSGDGGPSTDAEINSPTSVGTDSSGNVYIADSNNYRIRKITYQSTQLVAATPTFAPGGGSYTSAQNVALATASSGASIYYTTDGTTPTTASTLYTGPVFVGASETLNAIAAGGGYATSSVATAAYTIKITAQPVISPAGGTFTAAQSVTITDTTVGATIYYTTNGTTPSASSTPYTGAFTVSSSETVKAVAIETGYSIGGYASAAFTINLPPAVDEIIFNPGSGTYSKSQTVDFATQMPYVEINYAYYYYLIYYTTDGSTPTTSSPSCQPCNITVNGTETINAVVALPGIYSAGSVQSASYVFQAATPTVSAVASGTNFNVTISDTASPGATIHYTLDGSTPTASSAAYSAGFQVSPTYGESVTINAIAVETGYTSSAVGSATAAWTTALSVTPTFSPVAGSYTGPLTVTLGPTASGGYPVGFYYTLDGSTPTTASAFTTSTVVLTSSCTLRVLPAGEYTAVGTATAGQVYTLSAATPTFSPAAGTYTGAQIVTISSTTPGTSIYYTTNGTTPSTASTPYTGPISVAASETVEAIAVATGYSNSATGTAAYTIK